jgi:ribose 1,5-bisphosphokinase
MSRPETIPDSLAGRRGPGALVLVVGPSGAGKDTLLAGAQRELAADPRIVFPRRAVTRESSAFENNEVVTPEAFDRAVASGAYALWWRAHGHAYGIPRSIDDEIAAGRIVVVNASRTVAGEARTRYRDVAVALITAPADVLAERLAARGRRSDGNFGDRLMRATLATDGEPDIEIGNVGAVDEGAGRLAEFIKLVLSRNGSDRLAASAG